MAFTVRLYHYFGRDINSTELPALGNNYQSHDDFECELFEPCSIISPQILLALPIDYPIAEVNYAYIGQFNRYYWVNDPRWVNGMWLLSLEVDVLATYRAHIGASSQYVVRAASSYNGSITDTLYPPNGVFTQHVVNMANTVNPFNPTIANGCFIVGIVGQADSDLTGGSTGIARFGAVNYYQFSPTEFADFLNALMANAGDWTSAASSDLKAQTVKLILNPMQYITSCMWYPVAPSGTVLTSNIPFGWWNISKIGHRKPPTTGGYPATNGIIGFDDLGNARHPQAGRGEYLNREPYTTYKLYIPMCGYIDLPGRIIAKSGYLGVAYKIDMVSGNATFDIYGRTSSSSSEDMPITRVNTKLGIDVPIAQLTIDTIGAAKSGANTIVGAISNAVTGNIGGVISNLINGGIDTAVKATQPIANIMPSTGSLSSYLFAPVLLCEYQSIANEAQSVIGRPLCNYVQISTLSGYVQCATAHIEIPAATRGEVEQIESFMKGGFFYA